MFQDGASIRGQMGRWRSLVELASKWKDEFENLKCFNCSREGYSACKHCAIIVCGKCLYKYFNHKDIKIIGVEL